MIRHAIATLACLPVVVALTACPASPTPPPNSGHAPAASSAELAAETRARECNDLVSVINRAAEEIDRIGDGGAELSGGDLESMARTLDKSGTAVAALTPSLPALKKHASDYVSMARATASASHTLAEAMRGEDATRIETARKALEAAVDPEERIVRDVNAFCQAP